MDTKFKQETVNLAQSLEKWEEAYIQTLTRQANAFQEKILGVKKILNDSITHSHRLNEKEVKFMESLILEFQKKIERCSQRLEKNEGIKKSHEVLDRMVKKMS